MSTSYEAKTPKELKNLILRRLGAPIVNVEVTERQVFDCIDRAIELYIDYYPDGLNKTYVICRLDEEQAATGIIKFDTPIYAITKILRDGNVLGSMDGNATYTWFTDFVNGLASFGGGSTYTLFAGAADISTYYMFQSYFNQLQDTLNPLDDYWFNSASNMVRLLGNHRVGEHVIFECWVPAATYIENATNAVGNSSVLVGDESPSIVDRWNDPRSVAKSTVVGSDDYYSEQGVYNVRWVKDYATALVKQLNGYILSKHQGMQLIGGVQIDGKSIYTDATEEVQNLRDELMALSEPLPIIWG